MISHEYVISPVGMVQVSADETGIVSVSFMGNSTAVPGGDAGENAPGRAIAREGARQLSEYFAGKRRGFDLPLSYGGTPFQEKAWEGLLQIPYGETRTYGQQADLIGSPKACRAVGGANGKNPISIIIPCHRVVAAGGKLGGYTGGLSYKRFLLDLEASVMRGKE